MKFTVEFEVPDGMFEVVSKRDVETEKVKESRFQFVVGEFATILNTYNSEIPFENGEMVQVVARENLYPDCCSWHGCWLPVYLCKGGDGKLGSIGEGLLTKV